MLFVILTDAGCWCVSEPRRDKWVIWELIYFELILILIFFFWKIKKKFQLTKCLFFSFEHHQQITFDNNTFRE